MSDAVETEGQTPARTSWQVVVAYSVASVIVIIYSVFLFVLLKDMVFAAEPKGNWERALILLNTLSAVAFAAFGVLLGTSVQAIAVDTAKKEANKAKAGKAATDSTNDLMKDRLVKAKNAIKVMKANNVRTAPGPGARNLLDPADARFAAPESGLDEVERYLDEALQA